MKFLMLLLLSFSTNNDAVIINRYIKVPQRGYSLYSREVLFDKQNFDYLKIDEILFSINSSLALEDDSTVLKELQKVGAAYRSRYFDNDEFQKSDNYEIFTSKVTSKNLYAYRDTIYIVYKFKIDCILIDSTNSSKYFPYAYASSAVSQKEVNFPYLLIYGINEVKSLTKQEAKILSLRKLRDDYFFLNLEE